MYSYNIYMYIKPFVVGPARHDDDDVDNIIRRVPTHYTSELHYTRAHIYPRTRTLGERVLREFSLGLGRRHRCRRRRRCNE